MKQKIDELEGELSTLQDRRDEVQESLNMLTDSMASQNGERPAKAEIRGLQTDKQALVEAIERKSKDKAELEEQLQVALSNEADEKQYQEFVDRAEKADELRKKYYDKAREINDLLETHIPELSRLKSEWREHVKESLYFAEGIAKGFQSATARKLYSDTEGISTTPADALIERAKENDIELKALFDREITSSQHWYHARSEIDFPALSFGSLLQDLTTWNIVFDLMEEQENE